MDFHGLLRRDLQFLCKRNKIPANMTNVAMADALNALEIGRIKKIMQADEDVGKIALAVPVLVSKALELFLQDLCDHTYEITLQRGAKTVSSLHLYVDCSNIFFIASHCCKLLIATTQITILNYLNFQIL